MAAPHQQRPANPLDDRSIQCSQCGRRFPERRIEIGLCPDCLHIWERQLIKAYELAARVFFAKIFDQNAAHSDSFQAALAKRCLGQELTIRRDEYDWIWTIV